MKELIKILTWAFFAVLVFILQANCFFAIRGINPNLILLIIFLAVILEKKLFGFLFLTLAIILLSFVFLPFWPKEIFIAAGLGLAFFSLRKFLTGNIFFDFLIMIFSGTLAFYSIINFHYLVSDPITVIAELLYNMTLGVILVIILKFFQKQTKFV